MQLALLTGLICYGENAGALRRVVQVGCRCISTCVVSRLKRAESILGRMTSIALQPEISANPARSRCGDLAKAISGPVLGAAGCAARDECSVYVRLHAAQIPLADQQSAPFAGEANVSFDGTPWTRDISHGEMIRAATMKPWPSTGATWSTSTKASIRVRQRPMNACRTAWDYCDNDDQRLPHGGALSERRWPGDNRMVAESQRNLGPPRWPPGDRQRGDPEGRASTPSVADIVDLTGETFL